MPINPKLLIAAPMLQDFIIDKTAFPMANGTITLYHDLNRSFLKNWYYQTGTPGTYTWLPLPNPLTLSAAGTITDVNGVDTIPFYYPFLESDDTILDPYFVVIENSAHTNQITRANFPYVSEVHGQPTTVTTFQNLITNNGFWRNYLPNNIGASTVSFTYVAPGTAPTSTNLVLTQQSVSVGSFTTWYTGIVSPSQHDGFSFPDCQFIKDTTTAADTCTFTPFPLTTNQPINGTNTPEYYLSHHSPGGGGETIKCYQFPIAFHVNNLTSLPYTVQIQAQNAGSGPGTIILKLLQYLGTGVTSTNPLTIGQTSLTLSSAWNTYPLTDIFPSASGLTLGAGSDDAYYLQIWLPTDTDITINFTKPCLYIVENAVPAYDFQTYDQVNAIISSPRTGDIRVSANSFYPYGWVPMNDNGIGIKNAHASVAYVRANADTWPLFNLLYKLALPYDTGSTFNPIAQLYEITGPSTVTAINYSGNAYNDFIGNSGQNALQLTKMMGRVLMGTVPLPVSAGGANNQDVTFTNNAGSLVAIGTNGAYFYQGQPIAFVALTGTLPTTLNANAIYYVSVIVGNAFTLAATYAAAIATTPVIAFPGAPIVGTFKVYTDIPGTVTGQYAHVQLEAELATHSHPGSTIVASNFTTGAAAGATTYLTPTGSTAVSVAPDGSSTPFNITQPGTFYNMYIKL
jgi:hypothetical protein